MEKRFRVSKNIQLKKRILILSEGETTELNYFNGMKHDEVLRRKLASVELEIYTPKNNSPKGIVQEAMKKIAIARSERNNYESVWVVFDRDSHADIHVAFSMADANKIRVAFSSRCFEYWLLLHFVQTLKHYHKCDDVIDELKKYYPEYEKSGSHYERLKDQIDTAIQNAQWVIGQTTNLIQKGSKVYELSAYTNVHELVQFLYAME